MMQFLSPATMALAAGLTIPPLIALYFLKLRRTVMPISSTLLWRKAIEDLHVNAPFQRLRSSLLLILQLLVLLLAALALGRPTLTREKVRDKSLVLMIDRSASMAVDEGGNVTRLDLARREAARVLDAMDENSRAMIVAFSDRASIVSSFDTNTEALKRKLNEIEQSDGGTSLTEAVALAEAYTQNMIIGGPTAGADIEVQSTESQPTVLLFTDGRVFDAATLSPQRLDLSKLEVVVVGARSDNVGIVAMDARRHYERPDVVQVFATVRNFSPTPAEFDASLIINDRHVDVQAVRLEPGRWDSPTDTSKASNGAGREVANHDALPAGERHRPGNGETGANRDVEAGLGAPPGSMAAVAFDEVAFDGSGVVEVRLSIQDALPADNKAWAVVPPPRAIDVLLVRDRPRPLESVLNSIGVNLTTLTPADYESVPQEQLFDGDRSRHDVVVFDGHGTARLGVGSYMFWGAVPRLEGVEDRGIINNEVVIDWVETHPILRNINVGSLDVFTWKRLLLPERALRLIEGESPDSTLLAWFTSGPSQFLVVAFPFVFELDGRAYENTDWPRNVEFVMFNNDAVNFLASAAATGGSVGARPGDPVTIPLPPGAGSVTVARPNGQRETIPATTPATAVYARTDGVGIYRVEPSLPERGTFAVNLFDADEGNVAPISDFTVGGTRIAARQGRVRVNEPAWRYFVLALLVSSMIEWSVYNRRVRV